MDVETKLKPSSSSCESFFAEYKTENISEEEMSALVLKIDRNKVDVKEIQPFEKVSKAIFILVIFY